MPGSGISGPPTRTGSHSFERSGFSGYPFGQRLVDFAGFDETAGSGVGALTPRQAFRQNRRGNDRRPAAPLFQDRHTEPSVPERGAGSLRAGIRMITGATMKNMTEIGVRALKQNASRVVAEAAAGEVITVTSQGEPVAKLIGIGRSRVDELVESGLASPARGDLADLPAPDSGPSLSAALEAMRSAERY